jgi:dihydropteroate synthase
MRREDRAFSRTASMVLRGELISLKTPLVMGILNLDTESFYAGSRVKGIDAALSKVAQMQKEGLDILDIGASSSRPGAPIIAAEEEWTRLKDTLSEIKNNFPKLYMSIDTLHWSVAERCLDQGVDLINDISGGTFDAEMISGIGLRKTPYICMHMKGTPATMQRAAQYTDVLTEVIAYLSERVQTCRAAGIEQLILDPGFGFGKTSLHNFELLQGLGDIASLGCPLLVGISRKRMIYGNLDGNPEEALNGTTALHMAALERGADILRVHDVKEATECIKLFSLLQNPS